MKKNGFTLIELLAVIVILGLLVTFAVMSYFKIQKSALQKSYDSKIELIEIASYKYGSENKDDVFINPENYQSVTISKLIENGYIESDYDNQKALKNPITRKVMTETITITYEDLSIRVTINGKTN